MWSLTLQTWPTHFPGYVQMTLEYLVKLTKPVGPTDISYWNSVGAKPKSSTPARTWSHVVRRWYKPSMKPKPPALTPPPQVPLHNKYNLLTPNRMCDDECNAKMNKNKRNGPKTQPRANQNIRSSPNPTTKVRTAEAINTSMQNWIDTILIGDSITQHFRMAKMENITFYDTSVR